MPCFIYPLFFIPNYCSVDPLLRYSYISTFKFMTVDNHRPVANGSTIFFTLACPVITLCQITQTLTHPIIIINLLLSRMAGPEGTAFTKTTRQAAVDLLFMDLFTPNKIRSTLTTNKITSPRICLEEQGLSNEPTSCKGAMDVQRATALFYSPHQTTQTKHKVKR